MHHGGATFIHVTHAAHDRYSRWEDAKLITRALDCGQGLQESSQVIIRPLLSCEELDSQSSSWHNYFEAAFYTPEFFRRLLGGKFVYLPANSLP